MRDILYDKIVYSNYEIKQLEEASKMFYDYILYDKILADVAGG